MKLRALRPHAFDQLYAELLERGGRGGPPLSPRSVRHVHALLRHILNQGVRWGWLPRNSALRATPPRVRRQEIVTPDPGDLRRLIAEAERTDEDLALFVRLAAVTGARRGELCGLRWTDLDLANSSLSITRSVIGMRNDELLVKDTKTHAGRRIALDGETVEALARQHDRHAERAATVGTSLSNQAYVFATTIDGSRPRRPDGMSLAFIRLRRRAGVKELPLHSLRHFAATRMLDAGVPVRTVSGRLGHANPSTTLNVYSHWVAATDQDAAAMLGALLSGTDQGTAPGPAGPLPKPTTAPSPGSASAGRPGAPSIARCAKPIRRVSRRHTMYDLTLHRIRIFTMVVEHGGIGAAALALGVSQPSVSAHLKALELTVRQPLIERRPGRAGALTEAGRLFYRYARDLVLETDNLADILSSLSEGSRGSVAIGASRSVADFLLPPVLVEHRRRWPEVMTSLHSGTLSEVKRLLLGGTVGIGIVMSAERPDYFVSRQL